MLVRAGLLLIVISATEGWVGSEAERERERERESLQFLLTWKCDLSNGGRFSKWATNEHDDQIVWTTVPSRDVLLLFY